MKTQIIKSLKTFCAISLMMVACHKNEVVVQKSTMSFTVTDQSTSSYWVVVSDQNGNVLDWKSLQPKVEATLSYPSTDTVNLTVITKTINGWYLLNTFSKVASDNFVLPDYSPAQSATGKYTLTISNPSDYTQMGVDSQCGYASNNNGAYTINVCDGTSSSLYVWLQKGSSTPRYLFNPQIEASGSTVIDALTYNSLPTMNYNQVSFNGSANTEAFVLGNMSNGQALLSLSSSSSLDPTGTYLDVYYPDPNQVGTLFNNYTVRVWYTSTNTYAPQYTYSVKTANPSNFKLQEIQASLVGNVTANNSAISYQLSGEALASYVTLFGVQSNIGTSWNIYSPFSKKVTVVLPKFPDALKQQINFSFLNNMSASGLVIFESTDYGNYQSFCKTIFYGGGDLPNIRQVTYPVKPNGTIGG